MGTLVTIDVVCDAPGVDAAMGRAFGWFHEVEARCSRFDERSELRQLTNDATRVSPILFEAVRFALMVAEESGGAFDPTVGSEGAAWRDVELDPDRSTIRLLRPLTLDLGAVAKGMAVDLAAKELAPFRDFVIDAGGDLYLGGRNPHRHPWSVGIRHPRREEEIIESLLVSDQAVCTSGDYERGRHILDPRTGSPPDVASVTVVAQGAMAADALATAAFVMGPEEGIRFLDRMGVAGLIVTPDLSRHQTQGRKLAA
jgi:thiamine biosynthesis lipoprotein